MCISINNVLNTSLWPLQAQESADVFFSYDSPLIAQIQTKRTTLKFAVGHGHPCNQTVGCKKSLPYLYSQPLHSSPAAFHNVLDQYPSMWKWPGQK